MDEAKVWSKNGWLVGKKERELRNGTRDSGAWRY